MANLKHCVGLQANKDAGTTGDRMVFEVELIGVKPYKGRLYLNLRKLKALG